MITREPHFYQKFRCLGGACPLTCCRDWEIVLDEDALTDYEAAPGALRQTIADNLVRDEDGDIYFRLRPDGLCALLDKDGLCPIQRHWGEEHLCDHCGAYPRFIEEYGCLTEACQAISCPEAARLVMEEGIFPLQETTDGISDAPFDGVDQGLLTGLIASRSHAFELLTCRTASLWNRLTALLYYADDLQDCIDWGIPLEQCEVPEPLTGTPDLFAMAASLLERLADLEPLRPEWPELLRKREAALTALSTADYADLTQDFQKACPQWELHLERLACYFIFRHWPKVVNDDLLYGRAALTAASCLILYHLEMLSWQENGTFTQEEEVLLWARFSREIEHLDENFDTMVEELSDLELWPLVDIFNR